MRARRRTLLQAVAFSLITLPSFGLYWAGAAWLILVLLGLVAVGMLLALWAS